MGIYLAITTLSPMAIVNESGIATFPFTHASDYVLAVTDVEYTGQELNPKAEEPATETDEETTTPGETTSTEEIAPTEAPLTEPTPEPLLESAVAPSNIYIWITVGSVLLIAGTIITILFIQKRK